jgi:hypothetical protein
MAIKLELEVQEVNTILRSLGKHPFDEIAALIAKVKKQGEEQLAEQQKVEEPAPTESEGGESA